MTSAANPVASEPPLHGSRFTLERVPFSNPSDKELSSRLQRCITDHYFNHQLDVCIAPAVGIADEALVALPPKGETFYIVEGSLAAIVSGAFLDEYVREGAFTASSLTFIDRHNTFCITPTGAFSLSLFSGHRTHNSDR
jgi:hypothetical protein